MSNKGKILSVLSISLIAVLLALVAYRLYTHAESGTRVESSIIRTELKDSLIVSFVVTNNEKGDYNYTFYFYLDDKLEQSETEFIPQGRRIRFIANINTTRTPVNLVRFVAYKSGDPEPVSEIVHHIG